MRQRVPWCVVSLLNSLRRLQCWQKVATPRARGLTRRVVGTWEKTTTRRGHMSDGTRDKVEGKLKEGEGKLTDDEMREKEGQTQEKWGEAKDKAEDLKDKIS